MNTKEALEFQAQKIQDYIFSNLDTGLKFKPRWEVPILNCPHNPATGTKFKRMNGFYLKIIGEKLGYTSNQWATFNNIREIGGNVKKGEKSTLISWKFALTPQEALKQKMIKENDPRMGDEVIFFSKSMPLFNIEQTNLTQLQIEEYQKKHNFPKYYYDLEAKKDIELKLHKDCEEILKNSKIPIKNNISSSSAFYSPAQDEIVLPNKEDFININAYYSTALHELGHATGHSSRLNRDIENRFGSKEYAKEEFRAELYSLLQGIELNLDVDLKNHTSYIQSWKECFKGEENQKNEIREALKDSIEIVRYVQDNWYGEDLKKELSFKCDKELENNKDSKIDSKLEYIQKTLSTNSSISQKEKALNELNKINKATLNAPQKEMVQKLQIQHQEARGIAI